MTRCSYKHCKSDSRKNKTIKFHRFPKKKNMLKCLKWIELCGNEKTPETVNKNTYICSKHFSGKFTYNLNPNPFSQVQVDSDENNFEPNFSHDDSETDAQTDFNQDIPHDDAETDAQTDFNQDIPHDDAETDAQTDFNQDIPHDNSEIVSPTDFDQDSVSTPCDNSETCNNIATQTDGRGDSTFSYVNLIRNEKRFKYLTGLHPLQFNALYNFLDPSVMDKLNYFHKYEKKRIRYNTSNCNLSNCDRLSLTLIRLRCGFILDDISCITGSSRNNISVIFYTWIQFMYYQISDIREDMFRAGRQMKNKPYCFKNFEGDSITIVIDCTEIAMQMPSNFRQQGNTFSSYKHSNTVKFLLGICPSGAIIYVSEGFEGSISDKEIFEKSDIGNFLQEGDVVMADRGFLIQDLCDKMKIKLYTPPLLMKRKRLTGEEELLTKKIAKARIHVERAIGRMKSYRILSKKCPILSNPILSNIFTVVSFLVNFQKRLVK